MTKLTVGKKVWGAAAWYDPIQLTIVKITSQYIITTGGYHFYKTSGRCVKKLSPTSGTSHGIHINRPIIEWIDIKNESDL